MNNNLIKKIKEIYQNSNGIKREVLEYLIDLDSDEDIKNWLKDVINYGINSGLVSGLIYNSDIEDFFNIHWKEINEILKEEILDEGMHLDDFIWFDSNDALIREQHNIIHITWFSFIIVTKRIANELKIEI